MFYGRWLSSRSLRAGSADTSRSGLSRQISWELLRVYLGFTFLHSYNQTCWSCLSDFFIYNSFNKYHDHLVFFLGLHSSRSYFFKFANALQMIFLCAFAVRAFVTCAFMWCCWDAASLGFFQLQDCVTLVNPGVSQLCLRGDGKLLASAGWDHRVRLFGWKKLQPLAVLKYHTDMVQSAAFSDHQDPRQRLLAAASKDQRISLWSVFSEEPKTAWTSGLWLTFAFNQVLSKLE